MRQPAERAAASGGSGCRTWTVTGGSGSAPAWSYFGRGGGANIGDPAYPDLLVRETEFDTRSCPQCGHAFAGIAVCLQGGSIRDVRVYEDGLPDCDVSIIESDGRLRPKPEWDDHPMAAEADGGPGERLVPHPELLGKRSQV